MPKHQSDNKSYILPLFLVIPVIIATAFLPRLLPKEVNSQACGPGKTIEVAVKNNAFAPSTATLEHCDSLKISNQDNRTYRIAVGDYDNHIPYPGFVEKPLASGESYNFVASQSGTYELHDHNDHTITMRMTIR